MDKKQVMVVGGGGYIGSHMVKLLARRGHTVTTVDNFSTGFRDAVVAGDVVDLDLADRAELTRVLGSRKPDAVMHFASLIQVGESMRAPARYYRNNVVHTINLLDAMLEARVHAFVFSSTAAVFGEPQRVPIDERHPTVPINPYGASKLMVERLLADFDAAYGLRSVALRYFNAAGADPECELGERHDPETHLIPLVLQVASGRRPAISVFGDDYDTPDGTCIRDYIHIEDLCDAHLLALEHLASGKGSAAFNLGNGAGFSVKEVIAAAERVTGRPISVEYAPRREGDPARLVADSTAARATLRWRPRYADLDTIVAHAWAWERRRAGLG